LGPAFGYYPNAVKTWLIVKEHHLDEDKDQFKHLGISLTTEGKRHLGAAIDTSQFLSVYVEREVGEWAKEIERLSSVAITQSHAAYAAFTHSLKRKWTYLIRTIPDIESLLQPLENAIRHKFLPSLTGQSALSNDTRDLLALTVQHKGQPSNHQSYQK